MGDQNQRVRRIYTSTQQLRNIGPRSTATIKFIVDTTPFDDDDEPTVSGDLVIVGRLMPNSPLYNQGSLPVRIVIGPEFPFRPPKVISTVPVYHPNIDINGEFCVDILDPKGSWTATTTLVTVIEEVTKVFDQPVIDRVKHPEAASLYNTNRSEYERVASELYRRNCKPRT